MNKMTKRLAIPIGAAAILGTTGFAFMASNAVPTSYAGAGSGDIAGYVVSNVHYGTFAAYAGDAYVGSVSFELNHPAQASNVGAYIDANDGSTSHRFTNCSNTNGTAEAATTFTCLPTAHPENLKDSQTKTLRVFAAS